MEIRLEAYKEGRHGRIRDIRGTITLRSKTPERSIQHIISLIRSLGFTISTLQLAKK